MSIVEYLQGWPIFKFEPCLLDELVRMAIIDIELELRGYNETVYVRYPNKGHMYYNEILRSKSLCYYNHFDKRINYYKQLLFVLLINKKHKYNKRINY